MFKMVDTDEDLIFPTIFENTPLKVLKISTRQMIGYFLNTEGSLISVKSDTDEYDLVLPNDIAGLAELAGFSYAQIMNMNLQSDPAMDLIQQWSTRNATVGELWRYLIKLDRRDIISSCGRHILEDCQKFANLKHHDSKSNEDYRIRTKSKEKQDNEKRKQDTNDDKNDIENNVDMRDENKNDCETNVGEKRLGERGNDTNNSDNENVVLYSRNQSHKSCSRDRHCGESCSIECQNCKRSADGNKGDQEKIIDDDQENVTSIDEYELVTYDDIMKRHNRTIYDAFLSYSAESQDDRKFVRQMIKVLETEHGLKLFIPGRDDIPGIAENAITAYIIEKRCRTCVVLLSDEFLRSPVCNFQLRFTQALSPAARHRRLIPVIRHKDTQIPRILNFVTTCDFTKSDFPDWVWQRLHNAIVADRGKTLPTETDSLEDSLKVIPFPTQRRLGD